MIRNMQIRSKLIAVLVVPLVALTVLAAVGIAANVSRGVQADRVNDQTAFAVSLSTLVHELQRERDLSAGWVGSGRDAGYGGVVAQRVAVNQALDTFRRDVRNLGSDNQGSAFRKRVDSAVAGLEQLDEQRDRIENNPATTVPETLDYYSGVIGNLLGKVDTLIIGGGMANTFLKALGFPVGESLVENDRVKDAEALAGQANLRNVALLLPSDVVIADSFSADANHKVVGVREVPESTGNVGWRILDIGPDTAARYGEAIRTARTVVWNGPMGVFEMEPFSHGTLAVAQAVCDATGAGAVTIVGGGDSVAAVEQMGLAHKITHISTGGGASLEFLEGRELPGVAALNKRA